MEEQDSVLNMFNLLCFQRECFAVLPSPWMFQALQTFFSACMYGVCIWNWEGFCCRNSTIYTMSSLKNMWVICSHFIDSKLSANAARTNIALCAVQDWTETLFTISIIIKLGGINYCTLGMFVHPCGWQLNAKTLVQCWGKAFFQSVTLVPGLLPSLSTLQQKCYLATEYFIGTWRNPVHTDQDRCLCWQHKIQFRLNFWMCTEEPGSVGANPSVIFYSFWHWPA